MAEVFQLRFDRSQTLEAQQEKLVSALRTRRVPSSLLYGSPAQASRWLRYHQAFSPSRSDASLEQAYAAAFSEAAGQMEEAFVYLSLGCGGGQKDGAFVSAAAARGLDVHYLPTDTSPSLVIEAATVAGSTAASIQPWVIDLDAKPSRAQFIGNEARCVIGCFGMIPNFPHTSFLEYLAGLMRPADVLLISANLSPQPFPKRCDAIVSQYDNSPAREWYAGALLEVGLAPADYRFDVRPRALEAGGGIWRIETFARLERMATLRAFDADIRLEGADELHVFQSTRFTDARFRALATEHGFSVDGAWLMSSGEEGVYLLSRGSSHR